MNLNTSIMNYNFLDCEGLQGTHMDALNPFNSKLITFTWGDFSPFCAIGQNIETKNQKLKIKFVLAGWIENPIKSVVLTFPIDKIVFPTVTLCPRDSRPDRWGTAIKIFDQVNTDCGSKRWDSMFNPKANKIILNSLQKSKREKKNFHTNNVWCIKFLPT